MRSYRGNPLDWICTRIRWPGRKTWLAVGSAERYSSGWLGAYGFGGLQALAIAAGHHVRATGRLTLVVDESSGPRQAVQAVRFSSAATRSSRRENGRAVLRQVL